MFCLRAKKKRARRPARKSTAPISTEQERAPNEDDENTTHERAPDDKPTSANRNEARARPARQNEDGPATNDEPDEKPTTNEHTRPARPHKNARPESTPRTGTRTRQRTAPNRTRPERETKNATRETPPKETRKNTRHARARQKGACGGGPKSAMPRSPQGPLAAGLRFLGGPPLYW